MVIKRTKPTQIAFGYCDTITGQRVYPVPRTDQMSDLLPEQRPPEQNTAPEPGLLDSDDSNVRLTSTPPLGQASIISRHQHSVRFTVLLEATISSGSPEVGLWHNHNGEHDWAELTLKPTSDINNVLLLNEPRDEKLTHHWYTAELSGLPKHAHVVSFTLKYRLDSSKGWKWMKETTGISDGQLVYQAPADFGKHSAYDLNHFIEGISPDVKIDIKSPETDSTLLYELSCPVQAAHGEHSGYQHHQLGSVKKCLKWFALVRLWSPWLAPRHGEGVNFRLDKDGVLLSFLRTDGLHVVVLGISGIEDTMSTFVHDDGGNVIIKGRNDKAEVGTSRVLVAVAESFEVANCAVWYHARKVIAQHASSAADAETSSLMDDKVKPEWLEEWYDGLTYCTWNALGQNLTVDKIHNALDDLTKNKINITNLIIDDNWQSISTGETQNQRGWSAFEANTSGFPDGMKKTTEGIRKKFPNINHIAVWHAILGYWGGIDPDGEIAAKYKTMKVEKEPGVAEGTFTVVAAEDAQRMYEDFYSFLSESGIDAVKTDAQFFLDMLLHAGDRRKLITEYQDAWTLAHLRHFSSRAISCMSQFPQAMFHSQLPHNKPRLLVRNSDDFFPDVEASHPWHIFCNAHNSVLTQHLNVLPDWDMFQTSHDWASFHAAARCVSGGPIYFTDKPGEHDIQLIRQMTGQTPRDRTVILRPHVVGRTTDVYNDYRAQALLKIGTYVGMAHTGTGILGVFNVSGTTLREFVPLDSFPGTEEGDYVVSSFRSRAVTAPLRRGDAHAMLALQLEPKGSDVLAAHPLRALDVRSHPVRVGVMGLLGKMTGAAAVTGCDMFVEANGRLRASVALKALGVLGFWISDLPARSVERDFMVLMLGKPIPADCVAKSERWGRGEVLEVDVERAWRLSGETPGWSNEVSVEVFMG